MWLTALTAATATLHEALARYAELSQTSYQEPAQYSMKVDELPTRNCCNSTNKQKHQPPFLLDSACTATPVSCSHV